MASLNDTYIPSFNLYLQSDQADIRYTDADCLFTLNQKITIPPGVRCLISLIDFEMPYSFYNINEYNNQLNVSTSVGTLNVVITPSNYDTDSITNYLNTYFSTNASTIGTGIVVTFNYNTNKFSFTSDTLDFTILDTTTIDFEMGFTNLPLTSSFLALTSPNTCNFAGTPYVELDTTLSITQLSSHTDKTGILARIPVRVEPSDFIFYQSVDNIYHMIADRNIDQIQITIRDYKENVLQLNGSIFSITLNFQFQYQRIPQSTNFFQMSDAYKQLFNQNQPKETKNLENKK